MNMNSSILPSYGYACNDQNMPDAEKPYCQVIQTTKSKECIIWRNKESITPPIQDMKVRFCCAKKMRAEWGAWGPW